MTVADSRGAAVELLLRVHRARRVIATVAALAGAIFLTVSLSMARDFEATAQLATISSRNLASTPNIVAALGGLQGMGVQATPALVVELSRTNAVLVRVGTAAAPDLGGRRLVDLLADRDATRQVANELVPETVRSHVLANADAQTGLIRFTVTHHDSAVARRALNKLIDEVNTSYLAASHAQAQAIAAAQSNRVDSAAARLTRAEARLLDFSRGNRASVAYSEAALGRTRLERERDFAQTLYTQAVNDRDAAVGRALEDTPALVVVDPVPAALKPKSRGLAAKGILVVLAVVALAILWILGQMKLDALAGSSAHDDRRLAALFRRRPLEDAEPATRGH